MQATPDDPLARVLELDSRKYHRGIILGVCGALLVHAAGAGEAARLANDMGGWAYEARSRVRAYLGHIYDIELVPPPPPPPPPPAPEEPPPEPKAAPPPAPAQKPVAREEARPAPAQAGKILTQEPTPDEPVDLTGMGFVTGNADSYAGGVTASNGTSAKAVHNLNAAPGGVPGGTGTAPAPPPPDISQPAALDGDTDWNDCPWPSEALAEQIESQRVTIVVTVGADGSARDVKVVKDPGHGFARMAKQCALRKHYNPARDRDGRPVVSTMAPFTVHFTLNN